MGTPHFGADAAQVASLLVNIVSLYIRTTKDILKHLERDSEWLQQQLAQYGAISGDFVTQYAYKEYKTKTLGGSCIMVLRTSLQTTL